ncbi:MAG: ankyrin repeat domain-containing protein, partial [Sphaerochaeta sp.]|nr:ankyrin repeat domain-containing protein [Sphaerochaeta sp.]
MKRLSFGLLVLVLSFSALLASGTEELFGTGSAEQITSSLKYGGSWTGDESPLFLAAKSNADPQVLLRLFSLGYSPFERGHEGTTLLMAAARDNSNPEVIRTLIDTGLDVDAKDDFGWTALFFSLRFNDNLAVTQALL